MRGAGHAVEVGCGSLRVRIDCPRELQAPKIVVGCDDPPLGWISRRLDRKAPSPTVVCAGRVAAGGALATLFTVAIGAAAS
ncbi:MAG: hypothetical protein ACREUK_11270 [Burkholderiales bacterium]